MTNDESEKHEFDGLNCPNCDHELDKPINDIWKDPRVKEALKEGRNPDDIQTLRCPECDKRGYYNEGSTFWCRFCNKGWRVPESFPDDIIGSVCSLADTVTVTTDGYDNQTL